MQEGTASILSGGVGAAPRLRQRSAADGIDESGYQTPRSKVTKAERRARMRAALEERDHTYVAFTEDGEEGHGDADSTAFIAGGVPADRLGNNNNARDTNAGATISGQSSMFSTLFQQRAEFKSRRGVTSWSLLEREGRGLGTTAQTGGTSSDDPLAARRERDDEWRQRNTLHDRQWREDESTYHTDHDDPILEHAHESVQNTVSIYARRRMYMDGLFGVERFITREEERALCEELVRVTQSPTAAFVPEEGRYCVNLYERELGIPDKDPLALSLNTHAPLLLDVFLRAFYVGLIPSIPNMAQVSEFVGAYSGYPASIRSNSIGSFLGALSLVSPTVMHMGHCSSPWRPKLYLQPRSLYVLQQPALTEYRVGFRAPSKSTHTFRHLTRQSKDYRIEVLFACVDAKQSPMLRDAAAMTDYAAGRLLAEGGTSSNSSSSTSSPSYGMPDLSAMLAHAADGGEVRDGTASKAPMDGLALKAKAQAAGLVGSQFKASISGEALQSSSSVSAAGRSSGTARKPSVDYNPAPRPLIQKGRGFVAAAATAPDGSSPAPLSDMARRVARIKERERAAAEEEKDRNKMVTSDLSPVVPGRYPERRSPIQRY